MHFFENNYKSFGKICYLCKLNCLIMKRFLAIILLLSVVAVLFSSCEKNCRCKNLEDGSEFIYYSAYSKRDCRDVEAVYPGYDCEYK